MRKVLLLACLLLVAFSVPFLSLANDPPHNDDSGVPCGECHGDILFSSNPSAMDAENLRVTYNEMCRRCHTSAEGSYHNNTAPIVKNHDRTETGSSRTWPGGTPMCIDCHHPHYQTPQFWYGRKYYGSDYRLFTGQGTAAPHPTETNRTVITYNPLTLNPKTGSAWDTTGPPGNDPEIGLAKLLGKTGTGRGAILLPNSASPYNSRMIEAIDTASDTITVKGSVSSVSPSGFAIAYGQAIKRDITYGSGNGLPVEFLDRQGQRSFAHNDGAGGDKDGDSAADDSSPNGICQVCHTQTRHWRNDGTLAAVGVHADLNGSSCVDCHSHAGGFKVSFADHSEKIDPTCSTGACHSGEVVLDIHKSTCNYCHLDLPTYIPLASDGQPLPGSLGTSVIAGGEQQAYSLPVACGDCHGAADHKAGHDSVGVSLPFCLECHDGNVVTEHVDVRGHGCSICHENADYADLIADGRAGTFVSCEDCHGQNINHAAAHDSVHVNKEACLRCHFDNVVEEHITQRGLSCATCHEKTVRSVVDTIAAGKSGTPVNCENCHHDESAFTNGIGKFQDAHHETNYSTSGNCTYCHVVGAGMRATPKMSCIKCHGEGMIADPQRAGTGGHADGPPLTTVDDQRVCFSCHLADGAGYVVGLTPVVTPLHAEPTVYGFDAMTANTRAVFNSPNLDFPGKNNINRLFPKNHSYGEGHPITLGVNNHHYEPLGYNFPADPYSFVQKTTSGSSTTYWVPSYESGGERGKASGSGKLTVTILPAEAVTAGAKWREDGIGWDSSGYTRASLTPRQHIVEGNKVAGWATPPVIPVTIPASITPVETTISYEPCPVDGSLSLARTSGGGAPVITWESEYQEEEFTLSGWTPTWGADWILDTGGAAGFTVVPSGDRKSATVKKNGTTAAGAYEFVLKAVGSSCPGNESSFAMNVTVSDTGTGSPVAPPYYGQIGETVIDTTPLGVTANQPVVFHLAGDLYGVAYADAKSTATPMHLKTYTVAADGTISDFIGTFDAGTVNTYGMIEVVRLSDTAIAVVRYDNITSISLRTYSITDNGLTITPVEDIVIDSAAMYNQVLKFNHVMGDIYAVTHSGKSITTLEINSNGNIIDPQISTWDIYSGFVSNIEHVSGDVYAALVLNGATHYVITFSIAANGSIIPATALIDSFDYQGSGHASYKRSIRKTSSAGDIFAIAYKTTGGYGTLLTVEIDSSGSITRKVINSHLIDGVICVNFDILPIVDDVIAVHYGRSKTHYSNLGDSDGVIQTFAISSQGRIAPATIDNFADSNAGSLNLAHVVDDIYLFANDAFTGLKTIRINTGPSSSLVASLSSTADINCNEMGFAVDVKPGAHSGPYFCDFDWGDGSTADTGVQCGASFSISHVFAGTDPAATVTWTVRNNDGYVLFPESKSVSMNINRDLDGDGLCSDDPCPMDPYDDADGDGACGSLNAYISNKGDGTVSVIRTFDDTVLKTIPAAAAGYGIAVPADGEMAYLSNYTPKSLSVLDTINDTYSTYSLDREPYGVALSPNGAYLYVAKYYTHTMAVYRTSDMAKVAEPRVRPSVSYPYPRGIAASPDGSRVYVTNSNNGTISVIRTLDYAEIAAIAVGGTPEAIAVSPDSAFVYVSNRSSNTVTIIRALDNTAIATVNVGAYPYGLAVSPDGSHLYVANYNSNTVSDIRLADYAVTTIAVGTNPMGVSITPDGSKVYVTNYTANTVSVIRTSDRSVSTVNIAPGGEIRNPTSMGKFIPSVDPGQAIPDITVTDSVAPDDDLGMDFGEVYEGFSSATKFATITNNGTSDLIIGTLGTTHPLGTGFAMPANSDNCSGQTLAPSETCKFGIVFIPPATGISATYYDSIDIPSNDPDQNPTTFTVAGTSTVSDITVADEMAAVDDLYIPYGLRVEGTTIAWQVTLTNDGNGGLVLGTIESTKGGATPFSVTDDNCSNQVVAPASTCTFSIAFSPAGVGFTDDTIEIPTNDPDESLLLISVDGTGTPSGSDITITDVNSPKALQNINIDFGFFDVHSSYLHKVLYIRNDGTESLEITNVTLLADPRSFSIFANTCTAPILPDNTCTITIRFDPSTIEVDSFSGTLAVESNDPDEGLVTVNLAGNGYQSQYAYIPSDYIYTTGVCRNGCPPSNSITPLAITYGPAGVITTAYAEIATGTGTRPYGVAATPLLTYVTVPSHDRVNIYSTRYRSSAGYIYLPAGSYPRGVAAGPDGRYLYVANYSGNTVSVIDRSNRSVIAAIPVGNGPFGIDVTPDSAFVYVTNYTDNTVSVIEAANNSVVATIPVGTRPSGIQVSPDGKKVYASNSGSHNVSVIDADPASVGTYNTEIAVVGVQISPYGVAFSPIGDYAYVANISSNSVSVIRTSDDAWISNIGGMSSPIGIDTTADGKYIYVSNYTSIKVIQASNNAIIETLVKDPGQAALGRFITSGTYDLDNDSIPDYQDNCLNIANSGQEDWNDNGVGDACENSDTDNLLDDADNCPGIANGPDQEAIPNVGNQTDSDADGVGDACDNCPVDSNTDQADSENDGLGDVCDDDDDNDLIPDDGDGSGTIGDNPCTGGNFSNCDDNCIFVANNDQSDIDSDSIGNACDPCAEDPDNDIDSDGICNGSQFLSPMAGADDNCPDDSNADQADADSDSVGDVCDNCPGDSNIDQANDDSDSSGNACDNCPDITNEDQADFDSDLVGDICDVCPEDPTNDFDGDGICAGSQFAPPLTAAYDNCPGVANGPAEEAIPDVGNQTDSDCDGAGDACDEEVYYFPGNLAATPDAQLVTAASLSWNDIMDGEYGYHIERYIDTCGGGTPDSVTTVYHVDEFSGGIDETAWAPSANVQTASTSTAPYSVSDANGSAAVGWENGAVMLHTTTLYHQDGDLGFNQSILAPKNFAGILGNGDFDIQYDFSFSLTNPDHTEFEKYLTLDVYFPSTANGNSHMYLSRTKNAYSAGVKIDGSSMAGASLSTTESSGKLRMIRRDNRLAGYVWNGTGWHLLKESSGQMDETLVPSWFMAGQVVRRNEPDGQDITAYIDNFRFNTVGGQPVAMLQMNFDENSWQEGVAGEVIDSAVDENHGTPYGAFIANDAVRGLVSSFDGADDYVDLGSLALIDTAKPFTVAAWVNLASFSNQYPGIISLKTNETENWALLFTNDPAYGDIAFGSGGGFVTMGTVGSIGTLTAADNWYHVAVMYNGADAATSTNYKLYLNGVEKSIAATGVSPAAGTGNSTIGMEGVYGWHGMIDDVRVYNQALTSGEVAALYNNTLQFGDSGLVSGATYCYRVYPFKNDSCPNWENHASEITLPARSNALPNIPENQTPADAEPDVSTIRPTLTASAFADTDSGDTQIASQWVISTSSADFDANIVYQRYVAGAGFEHALISDLATNTTYYWKVRYQDSKGEWSDYSAATSFVIFNVLPGQPVNTTPAEGAGDVSRQPELVGSNFADGDADDTLAASQWQVSTASGTGFDAGIVYDSGSAAALTSHALASPLSINSTYYWRVRYKDSTGEWSAYSAETSFITTSLISRWDLDEGSGTTANDSSGANNGAITDGGNPGASWTTGFSGNGLVCNGNDRVDWGYLEGRPANNFTLEAMVKVEASAVHDVEPETTVSTGGTSGQKYLFGANIVGTPNSGMGVSVATNGISVYEHSGGYMPPLAVYDGAIGTDWNHIVVTYTDRQPRIYLNGYLVRTGLLSPKDNVLVTTTLCADTSTTPYGYFNGTVDEVSVYGSPLTEKQVLRRCLDLGHCTNNDLDGDGVFDIDDNCMREYNPDQADADSDGVGNVCDYLAFWKLDEGSGTVAVDATGNYDGTLSAGTAWTTGVAGGGALAFDFSDGKDSVTVSDILNNWDRDLTISIWYNFPAGAVNPRWSFGKGDAYRGTGFGVAHWVDSDTPVGPGLFLNDGTQGVWEKHFVNEWEWPHRLALTASAIPRGNWAHFVWTIDRANNIMKVYKNGVYERQLDISPLGTNAVTLAADTDVTYLGIDGILDFGDSATNSPFTGSLDNIALYDFVLDANDVLARCLDDTAGDTAACDGDFDDDTVPDRDDNCLEAANTDQADTDFDGIGDACDTLANFHPDKPVNAAPAAGAVDVLLTPTLTASAFADTDTGDTHGASQWLITSESGKYFGVYLVYDSGVAAGSTSHTVTGTITYNTTCYWKVRYRDSNGEWSAYSTETSFTTIPNAAPAQPTNTTPADSSIDVEMMPVLTASAFTDSDAGDTHGASQWQLRLGTGVYGDADSYDSGEAAGSTTHSVSTSLLSDSTYYWQVRYQDNYGNWSAYSPETSFVTKIFPSGAVNYWKFDEGIDTTAADSIGSNNGTLQNGAGWTPSGISGAALSLDGLDDYVSVGNLDFISAGTSGEYSISLWIKFNTVRQSFFFGDEQSGNGGVMMQIDANGYIQTYKGGYRTSNFQVQAGQWYHIVFVQSSGGIDLYVDRTFIEQIAASAYIQNETANDTDIGRFPLNARYTHADMDEVIIFNRSLSASEIAGLY